MADILTALSERHPDKIAVIDDRADGTLTQWTFEELEFRSNKLAHMLLAFDVAPRSRVLWCGQNSAQLVAFANACRKVGVTAVPMNYRLSAEEAAYIVDDSDAIVIFADAPFAKLFADISDRIPQVREVVIFDGPALPGQHEAEALTALSPQTPPDSGVAGTIEQTMIYTSGTTGRPKGAVREGRDDGVTEQMLKVFGSVAEDVYLTTGPIYHSGPGGFLNICQALGNTVVLQYKFDAQHWLRLVDNYRVTCTFAAPTPIRLVTQLPDSVLRKYDTSSMRRMIANAAPWSYALKKQYLEHFPANSLFEVYGSTELGVNTILEPHDQLRKPGSCGKPSPGMDLKLIDEDGDEITTPNTPGEIYIRSKSVFTTYHKAQDKYDEDTRGDFHTVGDIAYFDGEGYYYICDRKIDMIISGGVNVYPAEIEAALEQHPDILDVAVFGIPSEQWGESVHAVIKVDPSVWLEDSDVQSFARKHLAGYKVPRSIDFVDEIPRTGSGKILKRTLRAPYWRNQHKNV